MHNCTLPDPHYKNIPFQDWNNHYFQVQNNFRPTLYLFAICKEIICLSVIRLFCICALPNPHFNSNVHAYSWHFAINAHTMSILWIYLMLFIIAHTTKWKWSWTQAHTHIKYKRYNIIMYSYLKTHFKKLLWPFLSEN